MINVVVASSLFLFREGIKAIIESQKHLRVCGEATSMQEILGTDDEERNRVVIVAEPLAHGHDEETARAIRERASLPMVMIAQGKSIDDVQAALKSGARGILTRSCPKEHLLEAVSVVSAGRIYVSREMAMLMATSLKSFGAVNSFSRLTQREIEILKRVAIGRKISTIGDELRISSKTVSAHKANIMEKLAINSNSELVVYAMKNNLFDLFVDHSNRKGRSE
ncbi:LuxR C-terminal-related transcriptional regulator [Massilia sp. LXY-6]|uniref:LuxR C-terminal-related transcriptional regulator n=1 Tax=Massilia sp. LXY-6 TaxID=3379823 RepID=UPI003EE0BCB6